MSPGNDFIDELLNYDTKNWMKEWEERIADAKFSAAIRHVSLMGYRGVVTALWLIALLRCLAA